jgi:hypothetical protein
MAERKIVWENVSLDSDVKMDETESELIIRDVPIAREIVQEYEDGMAYKPGNELLDAAWTAEGRWIIIDQHPDTALITRRSQVFGRMEKARAVKNLKDMKTKRTMARGIVVDLHYFKANLSQKKLDDIKALKYRDVSIGFVYTVDPTPGKWNGLAYDYAQRDLFIDHLAGPIPKGRCPMPYCGIGADGISVERRITGDPWEETEEYIRSGHRSTGDFEPDSLRTIDISKDEGIKAIIGCPKGKYEDGKCSVGTEVQSYLFDKSKDWTMKKAKEWFKDHKDADLDEAWRKANVGGGGVHLWEELSGAQDMSLDEIEAKITELKKEYKVLEDKVNEWYKTREPEPAFVKESYTRMEEIRDELRAWHEARVKKITSEDCGFSYDEIRAKLSRVIGGDCKEKALVAQEIMANLRVDGDVAKLSKGDVYRLKAIEVDVDCEPCDDDASGPRSEEERAKAHFGLTDEEWEALSEEEKEEYIKQLPKRGSGGEGDSEGGGGAGAAGAGEGGGEEEGEGEGEEGGEGSGAGAPPSAEPLKPEDVLAKSERLLKHPDLIT